MLDPSSIDVTVSQSAADFLGCLGKASASQLPFNMIIEIDSWLQTIHSGQVLILKHCHSCRWMIEQSSSGLWQTLSSLKFNEKFQRNSIEFSWVSFQLRYYGELVPTNNGTVVFSCSIQSSNSKSRHDGVKEKNERNEHQQLAGPWSSILIFWPPTTSTCCQIIEFESGFYYRHISIASQQTDWERQSLVGFALY